MKISAALKSDKLSETLHGIALNIPRVSREAEVALRPQLVKALMRWNANSFEAGRLLFQYREACRESGDRTWTLVLEAIADAIGCSMRTLTRLILRYQESSALPDSVAAALGSAGLNPIKESNRPLVANLLHMIPANSQPSQAEAEQFVESARSLDRLPSKKELTRNQKVLLTERNALRRIMKRQPAHMRVNAVIEALSQELYDVWGEYESMDVTIVPHPGPFTVDGFLKPTDDVSDKSHYNPPRAA